MILALCYQSKRNLESASSSKCTSVTELNPAHNPVDIFVGMKNGWMRTVIQMQPQCIMLLRHMVSPILKGLEIEHRIKELLFSG